MSLQKPLEVETLKDVLAKLHGNAIALPVRPS